MCVLACLLGIALTTSGADGGTDAGISLRFDWPIGLTAQVESSYKPFRTSAEWRPRLRYQVEVQATDGGDGLRRWVPSRREDLMDTGESVMTVVFDGAGAFRSYEVPADDPRRRFVHGLLPLVGGNKDRALAEIRPSEERDARELWDRIVTPWAGRTLMPGSPVERRTKLRVGPILGYKDMDATSTLSIETGVPCEPKAKQARCVRLTSVTAPDEVYVLPDPPMMEDRRWVTERCDLIADPNTLIPYSMVLHRDEKAAYQQADGGTERKPHIYEGLDRSRVVFTYPAPTKKADLK